VIDAVLDELARELDAVGVRGASARRLLTEAGDHLTEADSVHGAEAAVRGFGSPHMLAELVAAELATARTRVAAIRAFAVLAVAGTFYALMFVTLPSAATPDSFAGRIPGLGFLALAGIVLFPQIAFVTGCLALARAVRLRDRGPLPAGELSMQRWRTGVAVSAGLLTLASLAAVAVDFGGGLASWWVVVAVSGSALLAVPLAAVGGMNIVSARPRAVDSGAAETVFDDLTLVGRLPWGDRLPIPREAGRLALAVAAVAAGAVALSGVVAGDPIDGALRALVEAAAVLGCYRLLGRKLGLRG
jgi:hypothetical protein